jgi:hypothetical protein
MPRHRFLVAAFLALSVFCSGAFAAAKISLVTVSPGPLVFESFGHSAILVEGSDVSTSAPVIYEFGWVDQRKLFATSDVQQALTQLFESKVPTRVTRDKVRLDPVTGVPHPFVDRYLVRHDGFREIRVDALDLTSAQADKLAELVEKDFAAGFFTYDNFKRNCATGPRDRIFDDAVLGPQARGALEGNKVDTSLQEIVMGTFDEAVTNSSSKTIKLFDDSFAASRQGKTTILMLSFLEIQPQYSSAKDFYAALKNADLSFGEGVSDVPMARGFHKFFFGPELVEKPVTEWRTLFTPKRLREALVKTANPLTGKPVIDISKEIVVNNNVGPTPAN